MNFIAGRLAEGLGRKPVLLLGWLVALPIPALIYFAPTWSWVVFATVLLGINQGLTWSMTQTAKLDFTRFFLQPMDGPNKVANTQAAVDYCLAHPQWRLSLQTHKVLGIP